MRNADATDMLGKSSQQHKIHKIANFYKREQQRISLIVQNTDQNVSVYPGIDWGQGPWLSFNTLTAYGKVNCPEGSEVAIVARGGGNPSWLAKNGESKAGNCLKFADVRCNEVGGLECLWQSAKAS